MTHDTEVAAARGEFHFHVSRAALCGEPTCGAVFALAVRSASDGAHRCPACGGAQFIPIEAALAAVGARAAKLERAVRWALGETVAGVEPFSRPRGERAPFWWRGPLAALAFGPEPEREGGGSGTRSAHGA